MTEKTTPAPLAIRKKVALCAQEASAHKAEDLVVLNVEALTSFADYFVICSGRSSRQVQAIADHVIRRMRELGIRPLHTEGLQSGHWILLDYGDWIFHIFYGPVREMYDLESLWSDAERVELEWQPAVS